MTPLRLRHAALLAACFILLSALALAQSEPFTIGIHDACDPGTFNAAVGPGTCKPGQHGTTKFKFFIAELQSDHIVGAWRFNPLLNATQGTFELATVNLSSGQATTLHNTGGETHTFTKVASFGGGFVPDLNQFSGNPTEAPECMLPPSDTFILVEAGETEAGPTAETAALPVGVNHFQCCIHPWMRITINVQQDSP
jgi:hypothetical protein